MRLESMIEFVPPAPLQPLHRFGAPAFPPPVPSVAVPPVRSVAAPVPVTVAPNRRRRALPIALTAVAVLGLGGTIAGFAGKASSDDRAADLTQANRNLTADLDDADAAILDLERDLEDAGSQITGLEADLDESTAEVLSLEADLLDAQAELGRVQAELDAVDGGGAPAVATPGVASLNDGVVSPLEATMMADQVRLYGFPDAGLEIADHQAIADRACAAESVFELNDVVDWSRRSYPELGSLDAAAFTTGLAAGATCQTHFLEVLGL